MPGLHRRGAFTVVGLLVVMVVLGILIALLLPAVQAAREAARGASCTNNLRQIGFAMHLYHDSHRQLPAGWTALHPLSGQPYWLGKPGWAWGTTILPYLEQATVEDTLIHRELPISDPANAAVRTAILATYRCPSDVGPSTFVLPPGPMPSPSYDPQYAATELATANYVGVFGTTPMVQVCSSGNCVGDGSLVFWQAFALSELRDGLSHTFIVGERRSGTYTSTWLGVLAGGSHAPGRVVAVAVTPPNSLPGGMSNFSSHHPVGTNFLAADGSVHRIAETIEQAVYWALCTRASGDLTGDFPSQ